LILKTYDVSSEGTSECKGINYLGDFRQ